MKKIGEKQKDINIKAQEADIAAQEEESERDR